MRLLNCISLSLQEFLTISKCPAYAILSHTWGEEEVTFEDVQRGSFQHKKGYSKIEGCCTRATKDGYKWVWIDTCCIDKSSSVELSEAINSMYLWYKRSSICYAYLSDVPIVPLWKSRWFTRGWTLQETIAPAYVEFYSADWHTLGTKRSLQREISKITGIPPAILCGQPHYSYPVAQKMSWAAKRITSKPEDIAYCLMGIFSVNMPMLYGEGEFEAFYRLQRGIMEITEDHTLFTWNQCNRVSAIHGLLANSPEAFLPSANFRPSDLIPIHPAGVSGGKSEPPSLTGRGLCIQLGFPDPYDNAPCATTQNLLALLDVENANNGHRAYVCLTKYPGDPFYQREAQDFDFISMDDIKSISTETIYIRHLNPGLQDFNPTIPMSSNLIISAGSKSVQLRHSRAFGPTPQNTTMIPPPNSSGEGEWIVPLWASTQGLTNALVFELSDNDDQSLAIFSVDVNINEEYLPWCEVFNESETKQPNSGSDWNAYGYPRLPAGEVGSDMTRQVDRFQKRLVSGHNVSVVVRRRGHVPGDPPIAEIENMTQSLQHYYLYTLSVSMEASSHLAQEAPHATTGASRLPEFASSATTSGSDSNYLLLGI